MKSTAGEITLPRKLLKDGFELVKASVGSGAVMPIIGHVRIQTGSEGFSITAFNTEIETRANFPGEFADMDVCIPADRLRVALDVLDGDLSIKVGTMVVIKGSRGMVKLPQLPGADFPKVSFAPEVVSSMPFAGLGEAMRSVSFAITKDISRPHFSCVQLVSDGNEIHVIGASGFLVAVRVLKIECKPFRALISPGAVSKLGSFDRMEVNESHARFIGDHLTSTVSLANGLPISWAQLIPKNIKKLRFNREQMLRIAQASSALYETTLTKHVRLKNDTKIVAGVDDNGEGGSFDIDGSGDVVDTAFSIPGLIGCLRNMEKEEVTLEWGDGFGTAGNAAMFHEDNFRAFIAPYKL